MNTPPPTGSLPPRDPSDSMIDAFLTMTGRQADALEEAGKALSAEVRVLGNRVTLVMVVALALNTALVVGAMSLRWGGAELRVDGVAVDGIDAANAVVDQVQSGELPGQLIYPSPSPPVPPPPGQLPPAHALPREWRPNDGH